MSYRTDSINYALEYLEEARRELATVAAATPGARITYADLRIRHAIDRIRFALDIAPSEAAIAEVVAEQSPQEQAA